MAKEMTVGTELKIAREDPSQPEILMLLRDGEEYSAKLYPAESNHHMPLTALRASNVHFLVARDGNGRAVGTGAIALNGAWAELKRMWVIPEARRLGVSKIILTALEAHARSETTDIDWCAKRLPSRPATRRWAAEFVVSISPNYSELATSVHWHIVAFGCKQRPVAIGG